MSDKPCNTSSASSSGGSFWLAIVLYYIICTGNPSLLEVVMAWIQRH